MSQEADRKRHRWSSKQVSSAAQAPASPLHTRSCKASQLWPSAVSRADRDASCAMLEAAAGLCPIRNDTPDQRHNGVGTLGHVPMIKPARNDAKYSESIIPVVLQQLLGDCITLPGEQIARGGRWLLASPEADRDGVALVWKEIQDAVSIGRAGRRTCLILLAVVTMCTDMIRVFA